MLEDDEAFVQRLCDLLFEISQESLTLTDQAVESELDANRRAVFTGLLMLDDELRFQNNRRAEAELQLRQREARMARLIDQAKVAILDCGVHGVLESVAGISGDELEHNGELVSGLTARL